MVRLAALHEVGQTNAEALPCASFADKPFVVPKSIDKSRVVLISSAGLIRRDEKPFSGGDAGHRGFSKSVENSELVISHISVNFDRTAALKNIEAIFPRNTLDELVADGEIGGASDTHYSFMGATDPLEMEAGACQLAQSLRSKGIDVAVFLPV